MLTLQSGDIGARIRYNLGMVIGVPRAGFEPVTALDELFAMDFIKYSHRTLVFRNRS